MIRKTSAVALLLSLLPTAGPADESANALPLRSVWDGIYTGAQAERGEVVYASMCGRCHGHRLDGAPDDPDMLPAPPIAGPKFMRSWNGARLAALYDYVRTTMPAINPGSLSDAEFADVLSYMLEAGGMPSGSEELAPPSAAMADIVIDSQP
ncbi:MAG: cytochrome c [Gammaproteobacteria bacterium]